MSEPAKKFKIFVSSTTQDLKVHRERVRDLITAMGFVDIAMEKWYPDTRPTVDVIEEALDESDAYVGIFGFRYGERVAKGGISFTELGPIAITLSTGIGRKNLIKGTSGRMRFEAFTCRKPIRDAFPLCFI